MPLLTPESVELSVADLGRSQDFYRNTLGLRVLSETSASVELGAGDHPLVELRERPGASPSAAHHTGLYHFALRVPSRGDLGGFFCRAGTARFGSADHLVSEAIYLADPDGHGIEVYSDRPRETWVWKRGTVRMAVAPLDIEDLLRAAGPPRDTLPSRTSMGHVHLRVASLSAAEAFYVRILGFDVTARLPGAVFLSTSGYHHHFGLNVWNSHNAGTAPESMARLRSVRVRVEGDEVLDGIAENCRLEGYRFARGEGALDLDDPSGNRLRLVETGP